MLLLRHKYANRITIVRFGKECLDAGDYPSALRRFLEYLETMAEVKGAKDYFSLHPQQFHPQKDVTEMLMMSHVFFEVARLYDAVPKYHEESKRALGQFTLFSANQPFQIVNSELVRKHLKRSAFKNREAFHQAYMQIYVQSKKCYVVTFCMGDAHPVTQEFRKLKDVLLEYRVGQEFIRTYYRFSSTAVERWQSSPTAHAIGRYLLRPALVFLSKTVLRLIMK